MRANTVSGPPKEKLQEIKVKLYDAYNFNNQVEIEVVWQKCVISIGKACQVLRAKGQHFTWKLEQLLSQLTSTITLICNNN